MATDCIVMVVGEGIPTDKYYKHDHRGQGTWTQKREEALCMEASEARKVMHDIANAPDFNVQGLMHPSSMIKSALNIGEATNQSGRGMLLLQRVIDETIEHVPIAGRIRPA